MPKKKMLPCDEYVGNVCGGFGAELICWNCGWDEYDHRAAAIAYKKVEEAKLPIPTHLNLMTREKKTLQGLIDLSLWGEEVKIACTHNHNDREEARQCALDEFSQALYRSGIFSELSTKVTYLIESEVG